MFRPLTPMVDKAPYDEGLQLVLDLIKSISILHKDKASYDKA